MKIVHVDLLDGVLNKFYTILIVLEVFSGLKDVLVNVQAARQ